MSFSLKRIIVETMENLTLKQIGLIIIGILSFISSVLGIITAFKPDALSENNSILSYDSTIQSYSDILEFNTFIDENKGKIVYLKIHVIPNSSK
ncbi:MAG: hypothetical protein KAU26_01410 [Methylococcales bacterium]|nr:hypothetical protein [Methylococcales bacterium]